MVWESDGQDGSVYEQELKANGKPLGSEFRINTHTSNDQAAPDAASDSTDGYIVAWGSDLQDGDGLGVYFQRNVITVIPEFSQVVAVISCIIVVFCLSRRRRGTQQRIS